MATRIFLPSILSGEILSSCYGGAYQIPGRAYVTNKNLYTSLLFPTRFGSVYCGLPVIEWGAKGASGAPLPWDGSDV